MRQVTDALARLAAAKARLTGALNRLPAVVTRLTGALNRLTAVLARLAGAAVARSRTALWWATRAVASSPRGAFGGAVAAVAVVTVTVATLTTVVFAPLPGRGESTRVALELEVLQPPQDLAPLHQPRQPGGRTPVVSPPPAPPERPAGEFVGWAILDRQTGNVIGSETMTEVSTTASMIKVWIAADYLRRSVETGGQPTSARLSQLELVIRDSDNEYAEVIFQELGAEESIQRLISICRLTDSRPYRSFWSDTQLSPRDTARMGACIADGRAAGPEWTGWLLEQMRQVRGGGDFGIRHALPESVRPGIAIKNGWIDRDYDGHWHVNCLAIGDTWTMGVMTRYPIHLGLDHGTELCRSLAADQLPLMMDWPGDEAVRP